MLGSGNKDCFLLSETENSRTIKLKFLVHIPKSYLLKTFPENHVTSKHENIVFTLKM